MATEIENGHSFLVNEFPKDTGFEKPRAVVILLGWWGAPMKPLQKYADLYHARGCATVLSVVNKNSILASDLPQLEKCALGVMKRTASVLKELGNPDTPVLVHGFSNGGGLVIFCMERVIARERLAKDDGTTSGGEDAVDVLLVGERIKAQILDSAPAFPVLSTAFKAIAQVNRNNSIMTFLMQSSFALINGSMEVVDYAMGRKPVRWQYWDHMTTSTICTEQAYIYSVSDPITPHKELEELIAARTLLNDAVLVKRFEDSDHVLHLRKHPEEYGKVVDEMLKRISSS